MVALELQKVDINRTNSLGFMCRDVTEFISDIESYIDGNDDNILDDGLAILMGLHKSRS